MVTILLLAISLNAILCSFIIWKLYSMEIRSEQITNWLFTSLYSINSNVKLPDAMFEIDPKPAEIYNPNEDPYSEFNGKRDDFHS